MASMTEEARAAYNRNKKLGLPTGPKQFAELLLRQAVGLDPNPNKLNSAKVLELTRKAQQDPSFIERYLVGPEPSQPDTPSQPQQPTLPDTVVEPPDITPPTEFDPDRRLPTPPVSQPTPPSLPTPPVLQPTPPSLPTPPVPQPTPPSLPTPPVPQPMPSEQLLNPFMAQQKYPGMEQSQPTYSYVPQQKAPMGLIPSEGIMGELYRRLMMQQGQ